MNFKQNTFALTSAISIALAFFFAGCENNSNGPAEFAPPTSFESNPASSSELPESSAELLQSSSSEVILSANSSSAQSSSSIFSSSATSSSSVPTATSNSSGFVIPASNRCIVSKTDKGKIPYVFYEDPECVLNQLTSGMVDSLIKQGVDSTKALSDTKLKLYSIFSIDSLLLTTLLHSSTIGTIYSLLIPLDTDSAYTRTEFIERFNKGETFDDTYKCLAYENFPFEKVKILTEQKFDTNMYTPHLIERPIDYDKAQEYQAILQNLWRSCGQLPICQPSIYNTFGTYNCSSDKLACKDKGKDYICTLFGWETPTAKQLELRDKECVTNNTRFPSDSFPGETYVCYNNKWYISKENLVGDVPQEYFFNEDIKYDTMIDPRDGTTYRTITYENQVWMTENINYTEKNDSLFRNYSTCNRNMKISCQHGRFYTDSIIHKVCPEGWHLPKEADVIKWVEMDSTEQRAFLPKLFSRITGIPNATDEFGLSLLSMDYEDTQVWYTKEAGYFWLDSKKYISITDSTAKFMEPDNKGKKQYFPVRCIKD